MAENGRTRGEHTYWMTRGQLAAIGVMSLSVAILSFFIGLRMGRTQVPEPEAVERVASLIPEDVRTDALPELLARVERAAEGNAELSRLSFAEDLVTAAPAVKIPEPPQPSDEAFVVDAEPLAAPQAPEPAEGVPGQGFAVQLFSYPDAEVADAKVQELIEAGHAAYRVEGLVKGETWYRVRVGPYTTREAAESARPELGSALGVSDPLVTAVR